MDELDAIDGRKLTKAEKAEYKAAKRDVKTNMKDAENALDGLVQSAIDQCENENANACLLTGDRQPGSPGGPPDLPQLRAVWNSQQWWRARRDAKRKDRSKEDRQASKDVVPIWEDALVQNVLDLALSAVGSERLPGKGLKFFGTTIRGRNDPGPLPNPDNEE